MVGNKEKFYSLLRLQDVPSFLKLPMIIFLCLYSPYLWPSRPALIVSEKAIIYSDVGMTSPIGYVLKGKKIMGGEIPRNNAQVYPVIVSSKVAFIQARDISTEKVSVDSNTLVLERFSKISDKLPEINLAVNFRSVMSELQFSQKVSELKKNESVTGQNLSLKIESFILKTFDLQFYLNYLQANKNQDFLKMVEMGAGAGWRLVRTENLLLRAEFQMMAIPFASYEIEDEFRSNSSGISSGLNFNASFFLSKDWGLDLNAGYFYTKLFYFNSPAPYSDFSLNIESVRVGGGLNYRF